MRSSVLICLSLDIVYSFLTCTAERDRIASFKDQNGAFSDLLTGTWMDAGSLWGLEKLVFQRTQITEWGGWKDHKYAVQTRYMLAAGTHDHEFSLVPDSMDKRETIAYVGCEGCGEDKLHYHHFHNTINVRGELCKEFVDPWVKETKFNNVTHIYDNSLASLADAVRQFELETVGAQPFII